MRNLRNTSIFIVIILMFSFGCSSKYRLHREELPYESIWPFYRNDLSSTGSVARGHFSGKLNILWEYKSNDKPAGPLTIYDNTLIYPGTRNKIKFIDKHLGQFKGYIKPRGIPQSGVTVKDSLAYFAVGPPKNMLKCINLLKGKVIWKKPLKDATWGSIIINNRLIVSSGEGLLTAFNLINGKQIWSFKTEGKLSTPPTCGDDRIFQPADKNILYAVSVVGGKEIFKVSLDNPLVGAVVFNNLVFVCDMGGNIYSLSPDSGSVIWKRKLPYPIWTSPAFAEGRLYIGDNGGEVVAINTSDGTIIWRYDAVNVIHSSVVVVGKYVLFGTMTGDFYSLDASDGSLVEKRHLKGVLIQSPVSDGERVYVATEKGMIICFGDKDVSNHRPID